MKKRTINGMTPQAELKCWKGMFEYGRDFFNDLEPLRLPCDERDDGFEALAEKAWKRLGRMFMATWIPTTSREIPWALEQFGEP